MAKPWIFTKKRREALKKAQRKHVVYVRLGEEVEAKRHHKR